MPGTTLRGDPIVRITVTGAKTFESVRITVSDSETNNLEINTRNLLFGADANEGSLNSVYTARGDINTALRDMCGNPVLSGKRNEMLPPVKAAENRNSLEVKIYRADGDLILLYKDLWAFKDELKEAPQAGTVLEITSKVLDLASDLSGKHFSLDTMR